MAPGMTEPTPVTATPEKTSLRRQALARRAEEHAVAEAGMRVREHGLRLMARLPGQVVSGYLPIRDELTPVPLLTGLLAAGRTLALPVIETASLEFFYR